MKALRFALLFSTALGFLQPAPSRADLVPVNDQVRIEVKVKGDEDHKDLANTTADKVTQHKTLQISLSGKHRDNESRVVKWTAYGRNLKTNKVHPLETGQFKLALDARGMQSAESKPITIEFTPEHSVVQKGRVNLNGKKPNINVPRSKKVEAEGSKYVGYVIEVLDGTRVVSQVSDPIGIAGEQ